MKTKPYKPRVIDGVIRQRLRSAGAVLITGPKWCGKSTTGFYHARSHTNMDLPETQALFQLAPHLVLEGERPRLIDEWQDAPGIWDRARREIDTDGGKGLFIFTGSAVPAQLPSHTGTGRFARVALRTMSLFESGDGAGGISLAGLFDGHFPLPLRSTMDYSRINRLICRGGWPGVLGLDDADAVAMARDYLESVVTSDISRADGVRHDPGKLRLLLRALARNVSSEAKITTLLADISAQGNHEVSERSIHSYLTALKNIFAIFEQEAWTESLRSKTRIRTAPRRHFADPSLAAAALAATPELLLRDPESSGLLFESLCIRDLGIFAEALGGRVCHYRDANGFEVDAIVQLDDGRWGAVEIKLGTHQFDAAAANLLRLQERMKGILPPPSFLMILNATSGFSAARPDGVLIVPIDLLEP